MERDLSSAAAAAAATLAKGKELEAQDSKRQDSKGGQDYDDDNDDDGEKEDTIETPRLILERLHPDRHLEGFHELWSQEEVVRWLTIPASPSLASSASFMSTILPNTTNPEIDKFAIMLKDRDLLEPHNNSRDLQPKLQPHYGNNNDNNNDNKNNEKKKLKMKMIGMVGTNRWSKEGLGMETGYVLRREYWGMGYATEAFGAFLNWFWGRDERKTITTLLAKTHPLNIASQKVLQKCGGVKSAVLRKNTVIWTKRHLPEGERESDDWCWSFERPVAALADLPVITDDSGGGDGSDGMGYKNRVRGQDGRSEK